MEYINVITEQQADKIILECNRDSRLQAKREQKKIHKREKLYNTINALLGCGAIVTIVTLANSYNNYNNDFNMVIEMTKAIFKAI